VVLRYIRIMVILSEPHLQKVIHTCIFVWLCVCQAAFLLYEMAWKSSKDTNDLLWFVVFDLKN